MTVHTADAFVGSLMKPGLVLRFHNVAGRTEIGCFGLGQKPWWPQGQKQSHTHDDKTQSDKEPDASVPGVPHGDLLVLYFGLTLQGKNISDNVDWQKKSMARLKKQASRTVVHGKRHALIARWGRFNRGKARLNRRAGEKSVSRGKGKRGDSGRKPSKSAQWRPLAASDA